MLQHLRVKNLGVLEDAYIEPSEGFTVISGETGAGKTMLLGALRLLGGEKAVASAVGPFAELSQADGLFESGGEEIGVSRMIPRDGKSRGYLEGSVVSAKVLAERVGSFVEIVGQHDRFHLRKPSALLSLIDGCLDQEGSEIREQYTGMWRAMRKLLVERDELGGDRMALERELDLAEYQVSEIERAGLSAGDDDRMESMAIRLRNAGLIEDQLVAAVNTMEGIVDETGEVVAGVRKVGELDPALAKQLETAEGLAQSAADLLWTLRSAAEATTNDPGRLAEIEEQLTDVGELKRKYGRTVDEILDYGATATTKATTLKTRLARADSIDSEIATTEAELAKSASLLTDTRRKQAKSIIGEARGHLEDLGLGSAAIQIEFEGAEPGSTGADRVSLAFASDERLAAGSFQDVASGGELSRLVLALRLATASDQATTLVFDEVDAGVGGVTALALGKKLAQLGETTQVLCVTHLPQIAAHAEAQYAVERSGPSASVRRVDGEDRLEELSRMLAGLPESRLGRETAAELLAAAGR